MAKERLDKIVAAQSMISRKDVKRLVWDKRVMINGKLPRSFDDKVDIEVDEVTLDGKPLTLKKNVYLMLNKPQGVVSATEDKNERTVVDLVPEHLMRKGLFPAGRLDKDTVGFVLITDDGDFAHRILSPKNHIPKTYEAIINGEITEEMIAAFENGIDIGSGDICKPARLKVLKNGENPLVEVVINEGMYHQIKRMFERLDRKVLYLKRTRMGNLDLDSCLNEGECRELTKDEINKLLCN